MEEESFERALADLEIIQAAYPEVTANNDAPTLFPLQFTLHLTEHAFVTMEFQEGYPTSSGVQISSYRSRSDEKSRMEVTVSAIRRVSLECQDDEMEGGITCCSTALESWNDFVEGKDSEPESEKIEAMPKVDTNYEWISGEPLVDKKSTFRAHLCRVNSEQQVHEALHQLITGSSKIQRASHNMVCFRSRLKKVLFFLGSHFCVVLRNSMLGVSRKRCLTGGF
jgi:hypothetical protein